MYPHLIHYLIESAHKNTSFIQFLDRRGNYTKHMYSEIYDKSKNYASYLLKNGVKKGDVVSIMLPTSIEFFYSFFGTLLIGAVPTCLYPPTGLTNLNEWALKAIGMMNKAESRFFISNIQISSLFGSNLEGTDITPLYTENFPKRNTYFELDIESYKSSDLCFLQYSSGTTGDPKPVMITNENAISNAIILHEGCDLEEDGKVRLVSWCPLYHDMGLVGAFLGSMLAGGELTLIRPDDFLRKPQLWLKAIGDAKANITAGPNFSFGLCTKRIPESMVDSFDLSSLKIAICGAEVIYEDTISDFYNKFKRAGLSENAVTPCYGIAEGTLGVTFSSRRKPLEFKVFDKEELSKGKAIESKEGVKLCSLGVPLRGVGVSIRDEDNNFLEEGKVGRVFIAGKSVTGGYYKDPEKTAETIFDGDLYTGDEGFIFDGQLYLCGRIKDTIIIRGKNYYPTVFEEQLCQIKELREGRIAVSSIYDQKENTEQLVVLAEVKKDKFLTDQEEIIQQMHKSLQSMGHKALHVELFGPRTLPKTTSGKLRRKMSVELWKNKKLQQTKLHTKLDLMFIQIKYFLKLLNNKVKPTKEKRYA